VDALTRPMSVIASVLFQLTEDVTDKVDRSNHIG
jgi:hypothetical protein